jgi:hypothetical protein
MSAPRRATRPTKAPAPPPAAPAPMIRNTELIGLDEDGNMSLWDTGDVQPLTEFGGSGPYIEGAHYVIQWKGHAITVHCNGSRYGNIRVLFMCSAGDAKQIPFDEVEAMLLGKVIPDPEHQARIMLMFAQIKEAMSAKHQAPHLRRGKI